MLRFIEWLKSLFQKPVKEKLIGQQPVEKELSVEYIASIIEEGEPIAPRRLIDFNEVVCDYIDGMSVGHREDVINLINNVCQIKPGQLQHIKYDLAKIEPFSSLLQDDEMTVEFTNDDKVVILSKSDRKERQDIINKPFKISSLAPSLPK